MYMKTFLFLFLFLFLLFAYRAEATYYVVSGCGDGSAGDVTYSSSTALTGAVFARRLTVNAGVYLNVANYPIFVTTKLLNNGIIANNGNNANGCTQGGLASNATVYKSFIAGVKDSVMHLSTKDCSGGPSDGVSCTASSGGNAETVSVGGLVSTNGSTGGMGGDAGRRWGGHGGEPGAGGAVTNIGKYGWRNPLNTLLGKYNTATGTLTSFGYNGGVASSACGGGGACGASDSHVAPGQGAIGGASGANGGYVYICSYDLDNRGTISANGGKGGDACSAKDATCLSYPCVGAAGGGGGGGCGCGGAGGQVILVHHVVTNRGTITANAGASGSASAGAKGINGGKNGTNGACNCSGVRAGVVIDFNL